MAEILGTAGNDELFGGQGGDSLFGLEGNDTVFSVIGENFIFGNQGADTLVGNDGNDTVFGGKGDDFIDDLEGGDDQFFGNLDNDLLSGGEGNDQLFGGQGDDGVFGDAGNDLVSGDKGDDNLTGVELENITNPGFGEIDTLVGGEGFDIFRLVGFESPSYYVGLGDSDFALITDFNIAEDLIFVSETDNITVSDVDLGEFSSGAGIFSQNGDLIGFVQGLTASQLRFDIDIVRG